MTMEYAAMIMYFAMTQSQYRQLTQLLNQFHQDTSKQKRLYEVHLSSFDLVAFERPSNPRTYCLNRSLLESLVDPKKAQQVIQGAFGHHSVEFVPLKRNSD